MALSLVRQAANRMVVQSCTQVSLQRTISLTSRCLTAKVINGTALAREIKDDVRAEIEELVSMGKRRPNLSVILVGDDPASLSYIKNKVKAAAYTGITSELINLPSDTSQEALVREIERLNNDHDVDGLLVQLPVPEHMEEKMVMNSIAPHKDVDGFHTLNVGMFCVDQKAFVPATPAGVMEILRRSGIETFGKNAVVCGRSKNVGMPIAILLHADGIHETRAGDATTTICHRNTPPEQLALFTRTADIVVVATGIPGLIKADMIKPGAVVIDVGISRVMDEKTGKTKLVGDVDFENVKEVAGYITPVPGGVGPMTVAMLMKNTLTAYKREINFDHYKRSLGLA
ncbi:bifunctional methylenetetrahydrofolate dehydrogenase/cyclohydrolase, mitochondrial-like [Dreissena polymorpha]|uniref:methenyltetrahydrofolate cyclohydrolase n=1 Tax=Dreissena polymorpha TaxID=45954 RepID=A0A9D4HVX6_DREPO|nr:bifunctional methylenetetrahydrofolate dehydrogenase/cyclohydrolase, mitochondrial-like [Dreissena polymorpha]XP_052240458.1 bifunctional methylenetetrahydrofolate dehydrogenase/cyclohydrolase, mitochondrial-like [Dreissena polymorpha]XP_052240459.1 bifunctional methylenetetrahydrofolate dehydrogenase/cyclohydrolase, mitochondrial-like [Dreissena polymorpha]XP_052240460.1 bifunctional methylenetetrahydrofolate dehydrogenase/cyclohydrolase, mitochondrial-like [Dreissena polymorpha]KAH3734887.